MRDPEMFKYDVRVRERMLRAGRITPEEVDGVLQALPDLDAECEEVPLAQPAIDQTAASAAQVRSAQPSANSSEISSEESYDDEAEA